jgi:hypothetical protein
MTNSLNPKKKKDLEEKPAKSKKIIKVEDPSQLAQHMTEEQMGKFLDALIELSRAKSLQE